MKKKVLSLVLAALMLTMTLVGCTTLEENDKGAIIDMYLATPVYDFDPQLGITDDAQQKYLSLMFEGMTRINENGKWEKALMKNYSVVQDDEEGFSILINMNTTRWSDGRTVQASDFVYSWKRLLDPDQKWEGASLLYDIKNAKAAKMGDASIDDVGIASVDTYTLQIDFEAKIDLNGFFEKLSAISLVPLREDVITRYGDSWARKGTSIVTNGPFTLKELVKGSVTRLERSAYYYLDPEDDKQPLDTYVIPFRLLNKYEIGDAAAQLEAFNNGGLFYDGEIPLAEREAYADQAVITDMMATHTYMFNTKNSLFAKEEVRRALSLALDRETIADIVVYAKAATGYIPYKVFDSASGTSFREVGGALISTSANLTEAQNLLNAAGAKKGSFTITVRNTEVDMAVAEYVKGVWEGLGYKVTVKATKLAYDSASETYYDEFETIYKSGDFDVIAIDMMFQSADAFGALSQFATAYSGNGVDMNSPTYDLYGHISGYSSDDYNALIDSANVAYDRAERTSILHQAEEMLLNDMPVCPLYFLQDAYIAADDLTKIATDYYGTRDFKDMVLKDYMAYKMATDTEESLAPAN